MADIKYDWYIFGDPCCHFQASFTCCEFSYKRSNRPIRIVTDFQTQYLPFFVSTESSSTGIIESTCVTPQRTQQRFGKNKMEESCAKDQS